MALLNFFSRFRASSLPGSRRGRVRSRRRRLDPRKPIRDYSEQERHDFLYKEPVKIKFDSFNLTYEGLVLRVQKSFLSKDVEALKDYQLVKTSGEDLQPGRVLTDAPTLHALEKKLLPFLR